MAFTSIGAFGALSRATGGKSYGDIVLAFMTLLVIAMMVLPMPPWVLDLLVAANIGVGVTLLLFALYVATPTAFSSFPSVLLFTTLFRIALNVATTRQILLEADAGEIIDTFGSMVVGGSLLVGLVIFLIITIVQFIVVAKGSERVAEVGARFTLDAMPGKQIAIDSDLRAGLISQEEALEQRRQLGLESQFYGSMDGAMKFVKGDAIASMVIVAVNLLGGMAVGMLVNDMSAADAVARYAVLSIGDGLVTQIPALFVSMAAGIVVTRSADDNNENLASQISRQFSSQPRSLLLAGGAIALFALVPGFPVIPFVVIGAIISLIGFRQGKNLVATAFAEAGQLIPMAAPDTDSTPVRIEARADAKFSPLAIEFHRDIRSRIDLASLNTGLARLREDWRHTVGSPFPGVGLRYCPEGYPGTIATLIGETKVLDRKISPDEDPQRVAATIVAMAEEAMKEHAREFIGIQETRWMLATAEKQYPDLVRESGRVVELPQMANLLSELVAEGLPLRDMRSILEAVVDQGGAGLTPALLTERVRQACSRILADALSDDSGQLNLIALSPEAEQALDQSAMAAGEGNPLQWPPNVIESLVAALYPILEENKNMRPVLLTAIPLRSGLSRQLRMFGRPVRVVSPADIPAGQSVSALSTIELPEVQAFAAKLLNQ